MVKAICSRRAALGVSGALVVLLLGVQGCALSRDGRKEVAAFLEERAAVRESEATLYARSAHSTPSQATAQAETDEPVTLGALRDYIRVAFERNPDIRAAEETARAKAERIGQVTALPDPMVSTKTLPEPVRTAEGDNFFILGISERFPVPGKLDQAGRIALEETRAALERLQEVRLRIIAEVKRVYFQLYVIDKSIEITRDNQQLLRGLIDVARAQVSAGRRPQADVLRAQVELSSLEAELISLRQRRVSMVARMNEVLDRAPTTTIEAIPGLDLRRADLSLEELLGKAAEANPALRRVRHQVERDTHAVELAKLACWPDFTLGFEWMSMEPRDAFRPPLNLQTGRRPAVSRMSEEGTDNWAVTFGFTLPIWFDKIRSGINEAKHRLLATRHEYAATQNKVEFQIEDALERVRSQRDLAALFHSTIIPQAQQTYQVSQASYVAGTTDFLYVIDNWRKWLTYAIQYHRSLGELERSVADLEEAIGLSLPEAAGEPE